MATSSQYESFKYLHSLENDRFKELVNRGKVFISINSFYLGLLLFKSIDIFKGEASISSNFLSFNFLYVKYPFFLFSVSLFTAAFLLNILALGIYNYEKVTLLEKILKEEFPITEERFFEKRMIDFAISFKRNSKQNDKRAKMLFWVTILMFLGILSHLLFLILNAK